MFLLCDTGFWSLPRKQQLREWLHVHLFCIGFWCRVYLFTSQCVRLNTVCCLKETELLANDIWQRPSVMVMWCSLRATKACLIDVGWPWIHARKQETSHILYGRGWFFIYHVAWCGMAIWIHTVSIRIPYQPSVHWLECFMEVQWFILRRVHPYHPLLLHIIK